MNWNTETERRVKLACRSNANVLLTGETGTGKSRLARWIHDHGERRHKPFVCVNLASLHEGTFESELFGHERGAFTGADRRRVGRLEAAQGGTVFLDEVGELTPRLQARLLEFLQARQITPIGALRAIDLDVRVIAATHRNLARSVKEGRFREDLLHRMRVIEIPLLALRDRNEGFDSVLHAVLEEVCRERGRTILRLEDPVACALEAHSWPGNLRELHNVLEYAVISAESSTIRREDLPDWFWNESAPQPRASGKTIGTAELLFTLDYQDTLMRFEKEYLRCALARFRGGVNRTARETGINKGTLIKRMRAYGLRVPPSEVPSEELAVAQPEEEPDES